MAQRYPLTHCRTCARRRFSQASKPMSASGTTSRALNIAPSVITTAGVPAVVMALGAMFSALEVVPLALIGFEAWENLRLAQVRQWVSGYRWAIYYFVAVAFWNL